MATLKLRVLQVVKTMPMPTEFYGTPPKMVKQVVEEKLQWKLSTDSDWRDVPIVVYDADNDTYT
jgi:hypothetical protein